MSATVAEIVGRYALAVAGADDVVKLVGVLLSIRAVNAGEDPRHVAEELADLLWRWLREKVGVVCDYSTGVFDTPEGPVVRVWLRYRRFPYIHDVIVYILVTPSAVEQNGFLHFKGLGLTCSGVLGALEWAIFAPLERLRRWRRRRRAKCEYDAKWVETHVKTDAGEVAAKRVAEHACEVKSVEEVLYVLLNELKIDVAVDAPKDAAKDVAKAVGHWLLQLEEVGVLDAAYASARGDYTSVELWYGGKYVEVKIYAARDGLKPKLSRVCRGRDLGGPFC